MALCLFASAAKADLVNDFNKISSGLTIDRVIGHTLFGATRDSSSPWALYLGKDGRAKFTFSSGATADATWEKDGRNIICFKGLIKEDLEKPICKYAPTRGRGLDWITVEKNKKTDRYAWTEKKAKYGTSQFAYAMSGKVAFRKGLDLTKVKDWPGRVVLFRLIKTKQTYAVHFDNSGRWQKADARGNVSFGTYRIEDNAICMTQQAPKSYEVCSTVTKRNDRFEYGRKGQAKARVEVLYHHTAGSMNPAVPVVNKALTDKWVHMVAHAPETSLFAFVQYGSGSRPGAIEVYDAATGSFLSYFKGYARDIAFTRDGTYLAAAHENTLRVVWPEAGVTLWSIGDEAALQFNEVTFNASGTELIVGTESGEVLIFDTQSGQQLERVEFGGVPIGDVAASDRFIVVASREGELLAARRDNLGSLSRLRPGESKLQSITMLEDETLVTVAVNSDVAQISLDETAGMAVQSKHNAGFEESYFLSLSPGQDRALVFGNGAPKMFEWPSMVALTEPDLSTLGKQFFGVFLSEDQILTSAYGRAGAEIWSLSREAAVQHFYDQIAGDDAAYARTKKRDSLRKAFKEDQAKQEADRIARLKAIDGLFHAGDCQAFVDALAADNLSDKRSFEDCEAAANLKRNRKEVYALLNAGACEEGESLAQKYQVPAEFKIKLCRKKERERLAQEAFQAAQSARDCKALEKLGPQFNEPDAGVNCKMTVAMEAETPKPAYLTAVRFDAAGDKVRAKLLYLHIMDNFAEDDLALDAANRLTAIADREAEQKSQAESAQALAAAQSALEAARKQAERSAKREEEALRQARIAQQRADDARRQAADAAARAQKKQAQRSSACDHVSMRMYFNYNGGGLFGVANGRWEVIGINRASGFVTARKTGQDFRRQIPCRDVR